MTFDAPDWMNDRIEIAGDTYRVHYLPDDAGAIALYTLGVEKLAHGFRDRESASRMLRWRDRKGEVSAIGIVDCDGSNFDDWRKHGDE